MSRISQLLKHVEQLNPQLAADLNREYAAVSGRRAFGLNFERHAPETVELPGRPVRVLDKVRFLPQRDATGPVDRRLWRVTSLRRDAEAAVIAELTLVLAKDDETEALQPETTERDVRDLVVVAEFRDPIYPGLVSTGRVERGGDKPFHTVINAENFHALQTLLYTHEGAVDAIYIDPPYNTGARDWKYNNDYVDGEDIYRHSKWLAFMERRLKLARRLLNPERSVLIVSIDEKEYLRLGLLLEQTFPEARIQMVSSVINPKGVSRGEGLRRTDEYLFLVMLGSSTPERLELGPEWSSSASAGSNSGADDSDAEAEVAESPEWTSMMRRGSNSARADRPSMFYPIYVDPTVPRIVEVGDPLPAGVHDAPKRPGLVPVLPRRRNGSDGRWQVSAPELRTRIEQGRVRLGRATAYGYVVNYLPDGAYAAVLSDRFEITGRDVDGSIIATGKRDSRRVPTTQWKIAAHNASEYGSTLLSALLPGRAFPFPKSLYAVEDVLRFFVLSNPRAVILDFFAGSGTTAHAVMRLNKQDGGQRRSISVTNNEVSADEQERLRAGGLRPGDPEWEALGICDHITKPRIAAAISGRTPAGQPIKGDYKFNDEFPMSAGLEENVEFFTLTYETPRQVAHNRAFSAVAPLLWLRAGAEGARIERIPEEGFAIADTYGVLFQVDASRQFVEQLHEVPRARIAYVVTDDDRGFQQVCAKLPEHIEPVRLYESYLTNFTINVGGEAL
ncbi:site-specific DNA-methyltransferase [Microbacterium paludicola]|uniref:site-specific DNA-methyltransferase n=1 Tax=Microbacterium paludicola TaxID=300019 RepID=UPI0031D8BD85